MLLVFFRYLFAVIYHKYCIIIAGIYVNRKLRSTSYYVSLSRLFLHDLSKFSSDEFWPYAQYFYGKDKNAELFHRAWLHHVAHNDHHWEHFIVEYPSVSKILWDNPQLKLTIHPMPDQAIIEMIVDIMAADRSYNGCWPDPLKKDGWKWMTDNYEKYRLHSNTRIKLTAVLCALGFEKILPIDFDWNSIQYSALTNEDKFKLFQLKQLAQINN